jgi:peptidoglycan/xylan/chitin deacetylase (PgdA/CDA1 family)
MTARGAFVVSIDLELAWGTCDRPLDARRRARLDRERTIVERLLRTLAQHDVRATWAVVGHLLLAGCDGGGGRPHPEIPAGAVTGAADWLAQHPPPGRHPLWHGADIVERIAAARPAHELASHSFCHLPYDEARTSRAAVAADLAAARRAHAAARLPFASFVFPRNVVGFRDLLAAAGVRVYRGRSRAWYDGLPHVRLRRALDLLDFVLVPWARTVRPLVDDAGLVDVPDSLLLYDRRGLARLRGARAVVAKARRALEGAARRGEVFHLWFHPANFADRTGEQLAVLDAVLAHAGRLRAAGRLENRTLGDFAAPAAATPAAVAGAVGS